MSGRRGVGRPRGRGRARGNHQEEEREPTPPPQPRRVEELFLKQNPPTFNGLGKPEDAELWVRSIERIFNFLHCTNQERLSCVLFQLSGAADFWWETKQRTLTPEQLDAYTWENFKTGLYDKYIPRAFKVKKEAEFYGLKQAKMSVTDYDRMFSELSRYAPHLVDTDEKMADKFRSGLRHEIAMSLASHGRLSYSDSLNRALDIEAAMPEERKVPAPTPASTQAWNFSSNYKGKRKWEDNRGNNRQHNQGNQRPWQGASSQGQAPQNVSGQGNNQQVQRTVPSCSKCGKSHIGVCKIGDGKCFNCGKYGHIARFCQGGQPNAQTRQNFQGQNRQNPQPLRAIQGQKQPQGFQYQPQNARAFAIKPKHDEKNKGNLAGQAKGGDRGT